VGASREGRQEDKTDNSVWRCLLTGAGFVSRALARAAVDSARESARGPADPMTTTDVIAAELRVSTEGVFAQAGSAR
jgi:N-formylglutamate amidohydrolase